MANLKAAVAAVSCVLALAGCATGAATKGALIGALSGAALGAGTGALVSDEDLLGSSTSAKSGDLSLDSGPTIGAGALIGVAFGAIIGAMIGHGYDEPSEDAPDPAASAQTQRLTPAAF
jgi:hypothetical protein